MKKLLLLFFIISMLPAMAQKRKQVSGIQTQINLRVTSFLKWCRELEGDTTKKDYRLIKGGYPDTKYRIDKDGVEKYLQIFTRSGYVSETFTHSLSDYFLSIDKMLEKAKKTEGPTKIVGMEQDFLLHTDEPEEIFDNINRSTVNKCLVIYNKALISIRLSPYLNMLFTLTKQDKVWLIDYVGYDEATPRH